MEFEKRVWQAYLYKRVLRNFSHCGVLRKGCGKHFYTRVFKGTCHIVEFEKRWQAFLYKRGFEDFFILWSLKKGVQQAYLYKRVLRNFSHCGV